MRKMMNLTALALGRETRSRLEGFGVDVTQK